MYFIVSHNEILTMENGTCILHNAMHSEGAVLKYVAFNF